MDNFRQLFLDEAAELLNKLEGTLLQLEEDLNNKELINEVFRIMHSLKGSGAMFGFDNLSEVTHDLENLYDKIRDDQLELSSEIIGFTMQTMDHINMLLANDNDPELKIASEKIKDNIKLLISNKNIVLDQDPGLSTKRELTETLPEKEVYYIKFIPNEDILNDGTNPLYLLDELADLGETIINIKTENLPEFSKLDPEKINFEWTFILSTNSNEEEIRDVFIFVEDDSHLEIAKLSNKDLFSLYNAQSTLNFIFQDNDHSLESFERAIKILESEYEDNNKPKTISKEKTKQPIKEENTVKEKVPATTSQLSSPVNITTVNVSSKKLDLLINLVSELVTTQARLATTAHNNSFTGLDQLSEDLQFLTRQFRDIAFEMRLVPIHTLVVKFKRLVRDLSRDLGKKIQFTTEGTETEMDKSIITTISDPVLHIIRNCIDHGIETPDVRLENNKPETGTIHFNAYSDGASIVLNISDDGCGINKQKVINKALEKDLIKTFDEVSDDEVNALIMMPGFSTSENVSDVSGRGVGMDVVRKKIEELRGDVKIKSTEGKGTEIIIKLPLTLSIIDGLLVTVNNENFIIPLSDVVQIFQLEKSKLHQTINNIVDIEGVQYPFLDLPTLFDNSNSNEELINFITVFYNGRNVGLVVNKLISEYQAVLKPVSKVMKSNEIFAGATILGDGNVAMVLDIHKLIDFYSKQKLN